MTDLVLLDFRGPVATLTLNRPQRHNALTPEFLAEMLGTLEEVAGRGDVRALVVAANGRSFSTGGDARGFVEHADNMAAYARQIVGLLNEVMLALIDLPMPVITAVHGIVTGGSLGLVLASDLVLLAPEASFTPFYSDVGPSPDGGWAVLLPLLVGRPRAAQVLYLNETIDAETAVAWGIANRIVPADAIRAEAQALAQRIAAKKWGSIRHTRRLLHLDRDDIADRLDAELDHFVQQMVTAEAIDGFRDFLAGLREARRG